MSKGLLGDHGVVEPHHNVSAGSIAISAGSIAGSIAMSQTPAVPATTYDRELPGVQLEYSIYNIIVYIISHVYI
jgi:hypothetical protein